MEEENASVDDGLKTCLRRPKYQEIGTPGWLFGVIITPLIILGCLYVLWKGTKNDAYVGSSSISRWPRVVLIWRLSVTIYCMIVLVRVLWVLKDPCGWLVMNYFTVWNWIVVCIYFLIASTTSICGVFFREKPIRKLHLALQLVGEIEIPASLLVSAVVWGFLAPVYNWAPSFFSFDEASMHISNTLAMTIDFLISSYTINPRHVVLPMIWGALYTLYHLIMNATIGLMAYPFLATDSSIIYIPAFFIILLVFIVFFYAVYGIGQLKYKCKCFMIAVDTSETADQTAAAADDEKKKEAEEGLGEITENTDDLAV